MTAAANQQNINLQMLITLEKNPRGIPGCKFIDNLEEFLSESGVAVEAALGAFNELYSKYKYMETSFERSKNIYKSKVPDIEQTLELIKLMLAKKDEDDTMLTNYSLSDTLYSTAEVDLAAGVVYLWIGAGTMVEYTFEEAIELLETQLVQTHAKITELADDLNFLRGNSITVEVNMARLFNHSVKLKKLLESSNSATAK